MNANSDERPIKSLSSIPFSETEPAAGNKMDEETELPKKSGADFYLQRINQMMAQNDPSLGQGFQDIPEEVEAVDISSLTIEQKLKDRNPKTKLAGFEELLREFESTEEGKLKEEYFPAILNALSAAQPDLQRAGLDLSLRTIRSKNSQKWLDLGLLLKTLVDKIMANLKPQTKKLVDEIFIEANRSMGKEQFFSVFKELMFPRNVKAKAAIFKMLSDLNCQFGVNDFCALKFWELMTKNEDTTPIVRKEFVAFSVELHRWLGDGFAFKLANLKKALGDEISKIYEEKKASDSRPMLPLLEEYQAQYLNKPGTQGGASAGEFDPYENSEAFDIFKEFNEKWAEKVQAEEKWLVKKEMTDEFLQKVAVRPKLIGNYYPVMMLCKRLLDNNNLAVQINGVKILGALSKGLRREISRDGKTVTGWLIARLKERKKMADEVIEALKCTTYFSSPQENIDKYEELIALKNKELKENILAWLDWFVCNTTKAKLEAFIGPFSPTMVKLMEDGAIEIRQMNTKIIAKLYAELGAGNPEVSKLLEKLPKSQKEKILEAPREPSCNLSADRSKSLGASKTNVASSPNLAARKPAGKVSVMQAQPANERGKSVKHESQSQAAGIQGANQGFAEVRFEPTVERTASLLASKEVTKEEIEQICKAPREQKVDSLHAIAAKFSLVASEQEFEGLACLLAVAMKNFKESNPLILKEALAIIESLIVAGGPNPGPKFVYCLAWFLVEKWGDPKFSEKQKSAVDSLNHKKLHHLLLSFCELIPAKGCAAKTFANLLLLITQLVDSHPSAVPRKELIAFCKDSCANNNPQVKEKAVDLLCCLYKHFGEAVKKAVTDLNPMLKKSIDQRLEQIQPVVDEIDESLPRKDISQQIVRLFPKINDQKWAARKEGLAEAAKIIKGAGKISSKGLKDFATHLKQRLVDSNQQVSREALGLLVPYIKALGPDFKGDSRNLLPLIVSCLNDKQDAIRDTAKQALDCAQHAIGSDFVITLLVTTFADPSPELTIKAIEYLDSEANFGRLRKIDPRLFARHLAQTVIHKNIGVRQVAERFLEKTCNLISRDVWHEAIRDNNPTIKVVLENILAKYFRDGPAEVSQSTLAHLAHAHSMPTLHAAHHATMDIEMPKTQDYGAALDKRLLKIKTPDRAPKEEALPKKLHSPTDSAGHELESFIHISYSEPKDAEISLVKEKLVLSFGDTAADKMMSNEQAKLIESLSSLGLMRMTSPERYKKLINLILGWMYVRVFDTTRKNLLDLIAEFLLNNLEEFAAKALQLEGTTLSRVYHVFDRLIANHPQKEECLGIIQKFAQAVKKCAFRDKVFSIMIDLVDKKSCDPQLIGLILTELVDKVDLRRVLTLKNVAVLEEYTNGLEDLLRNEIYHFYSKAIHILGSGFFEVFAFKNRAALQRIFDIKNPEPEAELPSTTSVSLALRHFQHGNREEKLAAIQSLLAAIDSSSHSSRTEIAASAPLLAVAVRHLFDYCMERGSDPLLVDQISQLYQKLFTLKDFTQNLGPSTLDELLDSLLDSLITAYFLSKTAPNDSLKKVIAGLNGSILALIGKAVPSVAILVLIDMLIVNQRSYSGLQERAKNLEQSNLDKYKTKMTIIVNCLMNIAKRMQAKADVDSVNPPKLLGKMQEFFWEFGEAEKSGQHKGMRTLLTRMCEILGDEVWQHYTAAQEKIPNEEVASSNGLKNLIIGNLIKETKNQQAEAALYRRNAPQTGFPALPEEKSNRMDVEMVDEAQKENQAHAGDPARPFE